MWDLLLKGAKVVDPLNHFEGVADVAIENGKIAEVGADLPAGSARVVEDYTGKVLQPGVIDCHVHLAEDCGSPYGMRMVAMAGVTTCMDMAGPIDNILKIIPEYGSGINCSILQYAAPGLTIESNNPDLERLRRFTDEAVTAGAYGVKILGGHFPLTPESSANVIRVANEKGVYSAWHAGTTVNGSNLNGMKEAIELSDGLPFHLAHINAYCRGDVMDNLEEAKEAAQLLIKNPQIYTESYLSPKNGTRLMCDSEGNAVSHVTRNCLRQVHLPENKEGIEKAFLANKVWAIYDAGGYSDLMTGVDGLQYWKKNNTDISAMFNANPPMPRTYLAQAKREDGTFVVDSIATDGGGLPRNVIIDHGLSLVRMGILSLSEFALKSSLNPARMMHLHNKGHLTPGADADITIYDLMTQKPVATFVNGKPVLKNGQIVGHGATVICSERGVKAVKDKGISTYVADPSEAFPTRLKI